GGGTSFRPPRSPSTRGRAHARAGGSDACRRGSASRDGALARRRGPAAARKARHAGRSQGHDDRRLPGLRMLQVFIGFDPKESVAYHVLAHSILRQASVPVSVAPVMRSQLTGLYTRPRGATESTEFSLTRFLVPALSGFQGWSLYLDCDMLFRADIAGLFAAAEGAAERSVLVCKHDYTPNPARKFLNQVQTAYPRKNWSSVMLFNNAR